jgi:hypothetical protein
MTKMFKSFSKISPFNIQIESAHQIMKSQTYVSTIYVALMLCIVIKRAVTPASKAT